MMAVVLALPLDLPFAVAFVLTIVDIDIDPRGDVSATVEKTPRTRWRMTSGKLREKVELTLSHHDKHTQRQMMTDDDDDGDGNGDGDVYGSGKALMCFRC